MISLRDLNRGMGRLESDSEHALFVLIGIPF